MANRGDMKARIAEELHRDLGTRADRAIDDAIAHYTAKRLGFNESRMSTQTVPLQRNYSLPPRFLDVDNLKIWINDDMSTAYEITMWPWPKLDKVTTTLRSTGYPSRYAIYDEQIWFWPIPNNVYEIQGSFLREQEPLVDDTSENAWTNEGSILIRARSKADLECHVLHKAQAKREQEALADQDFLSYQEMTAYRGLIRRDKGRTTTGRVQPTEW